jgi:copper transport protein
MRRLPLVLLAVLLLWAPPAFGHAAFVGSDPAPGQRVEVSPARVTLEFTEGLNRRLARATLHPAGGGAAIPAQLRSSGSKRLVVVPDRPLPRGAYRVDWRTVGTEDGHLLEGSFSFGVRAPAAATQALETGPLARGGWLRMLARGALYAAVLLLVAALLLPLLVRGPPGWPVPELTGFDTPRLRERARDMTSDLAWLALGASILAVVAEAADAAGTVSVQGLSDFLLANVAGVARVLLVALLGACALVRSRWPRAAAAFAVLALGAIAASGHAGSADPRLPSILNDWLHLVASAAWLGGIVLLALLWWRPLRGAEQPQRLAVARGVLAPYGRTALSAFALVAATGLVSLVTQLGRVSALWDTDFGRLLALKIAVVGAIAAASAIHALQLRPRLLAANPHPPEALERRHWRLWRTEPVLGVAVVAIVAALVAFPLPPRQLADADGAPASVCDPCPLPRPAADELGVADHAGSQIVAGWIRRTPQAVTGTIRVLDTKGRPSKLPVKVEGGGRGGTFRLPGDATAVRVTVREQGHSYTAALPTVWKAGASARARRLLERAESVMRRLRGVRELESLTSGPGQVATTEYRLTAPDRLRWHTGGGVTGVVVGKRQWTKAPGLPGWRADEYGSGLRFKTRSWFSWGPYARSVRLLSEHGGRAVIALADEGTPAWFRLTVDTATGHVLQERMIAQARYGRTRFVDFGRRYDIQPPVGAR